MFILRRFHGGRFNRFNSIIDGLHSHLTGFINLIGSSTLPLPEVCSALSLPGSAVRVEGHIDKRYFPGTEPMDAAERLAEDGVRRLFKLGSDYEVNVQPHSATQANHAVWRAFLTPGNTVLGLGINDGGHISHMLGLPEGIAFTSFPLSSTGIDYDGLLQLAKRSQPDLIVAGASSYPLAIDFEKLGTIAREVNAHLHADIAHTAPFIACGLHTNVFPHADTVTIDTGKNLRGPKGGALVFRTEYAAKIKRSIFPIIQSSPNQSAILAKACMFEYWRDSELDEFAGNLVKKSRAFVSALVQNGVPVVFGNTDCHIILLDVEQLGLTGDEAERRLEKMRILTNRNSIPGDSKPAWIASGIRIGTTSITILGYSLDDINVLGKVVADTLMDQNPKCEVIDYLLNKYHTSASEMLT